MWSDNHIEILMSIQALAVYDTMISLSREERLFFPGRARPLSTWLYFLNRYINLVHALINIILYGRWSAEVCHIAPAWQA